MNNNILEILDGKWTDGTRPKDLYKLYISKNPIEYVETIIVGLHSEKRKVQSGCAELASLLSEDKPEILYPHIELFLSNLKVKMAVLRWEALCTLGNLASVDKNRLLPNYINQIVSFLDNKSIVLQGHAIQALSKIAKAFPDKASKILEELLNSKEYFPGNRIGFIIEAMEFFLPNEDLRLKIRVFVEPYAVSKIKVVEKKAKKILRKLLTK
jgi:hypothetical protein